MTKMEKITETTSELMTQEQVDAAMDTLKAYQSLIFNTGLKTGLNIGMVLGGTALAVTCGVTTLIFHKRKKDQKQTT